MRKIATQGTDNVIGGVELKTSPENGLRVYKYQSDKNNTKKFLAKALSIAAISGLAFGGSVANAQDVNSIMNHEREIVNDSVQYVVQSTDGWEKEKVSKGGKLTGAAAELPTPTLDDKHVEDPTTYPNPSAYSYSAGSETDYDIKVTDGTSSAYGIVELKDNSKTDWSTHLDSAPSTTSVW